MMSDVVEVVQPSEFEVKLETPVDEELPLGIGNSVPVEQAPVVEPISEFVYEYQPVDDLGRPLGAKQVFKGTDPTAVLDKVAKAHQESIKLTRELKKNLRLGNIEKEELPDDAVLMDELIEFHPMELTEAEKIQISRDMLDPEKFDQASERLLEAKLGTKPENISKVLSRVQQDSQASRAREEAQNFLRDNPEYYVCKENFDVLSNWMMKNNLAPIKNNFQIAYDKLDAVGLLLKAPIVREEVPVTPQVVVQPVVEEQSQVNSQPEPDTTSRITSEEPQTQPKRTVIPVSLSRTNASDVGVESKTGKLTVADIEKIPSEVLKKKLNTDPAFRKAADEAYAAAEKRN
jgi:hypothetical protein